MLENGDDVIGKVYLRPVLAILVVALMGAVAFSGCFGKTPPAQEKPGMISVITPQDIDALKATKYSRASVVGENDVVIASADNPFYALIATPLAAYYEGGSLKKVPLLVSNEGNTYPHIHTVPSINTEPTAYTDIGPVIRFLQVYQPSGAIMIGMDKISAKGSIVQAGQTTPVDYSLAATQAFTGDLTEIAVRVAETYWSNTEAIILVESNERGYAEAVNAVAIASYLNVPVVPVGEVNATTADRLSKLGIKYTITCGDIQISAENAKKLGKMLKFPDVMSIANGVLSLAPKTETDLPYVVMANPLDTYVPKVLAESTIDTSGTLTDRGVGNTAPYPGMPETGASVPFDFVIPQDYKYANVIVNITADLTPTPAAATPFNADFYNARFLIWVYKITEDESENLAFMANAVCYDYVRDASGKPTAIWMYVEFEIVNQPGKYKIAVGPLVGTGMPIDPTGTLTTIPFAGSVTIQKLESPTYPLMPGLSSLAPYLAAIHKGVVLAKPDFALQVAGLGGCVDCGEPSADVDAMTTANKKTMAVHAEFVKLLGNIYGTDDPQKLNDMLNEDLTKAPYLAILADTNMVPMHYYTGGVGTGTGEGGQGQPGDLIYSTVNPDLANYDPEDPNSALYDTGGDVMTSEVAVGRLTGWDVQDVSALIARSNFYDRYLTNYKGPLNQMGGKDPANGFGSVAWNGLGSMVPVEAALPTALALDLAETRAGFNTVAVMKAEKTGKDITAIQWESSNFIWMVVHGFWYHFVPDSVVGAVSGPTNPYAAKHVKYMTMGPSVMFIVSCITARIDGLQPYNTISQAFMHAGVNTYIGGTRSMWGTLAPMPDTLNKLGEYFSKVFYGHLTGYIVSDAHPNEVVAFEPSNMDVGHAFLYARNAYIKGTGLATSTEIDTITVTVMYADPAFNPFEPNHEGGIPTP